MKNSKGNDEKMINHLKNGQMIQKKCFQSKYAGGK